MNDQMFYDQTGHSFVQSITDFKSGSSSVGRAIAFQAIGREFEPRLPLQIKLSSWAVYSWQFELKYKCVYLHSISERGLPQKEMISSLNR